MSNTFCVLPWIHFCSNPSGDVLPCCRFQDYQLTSNCKNQGPGALNSPEFTRLRQDMLSGLRISGCSKCYQEEKHKGTSMRIESNNTYRDLLSEIHDSNFLKLVYVEFAFSNLCNLQCVMCSSSFSTSWYKLEKDLRGKSSYSGELKNHTKPEDIDLSALRRVKILGGEPLMDPEFYRFIDLLVDSGYASNIRLMISTNCTIPFNEKLKHQLKKFFSVKISCSIDGFGILNDYIRRGSVWSKIKHIFLDITDLNNELGIDVCTHTTISVFNVNCIDQLFEWFSDKNLHKSSLDVVVKNSPTSIQLLANPKKDKVQSLISKNKYQTERIIGMMNSYIPTEEESYKSLEFIRKIDNIQQNKLYIINPDISKILFEDQST